MHDAVTEEQSQKPVLWTTPSTDGLHGTALLSSQAVKLA